MPWGEGEHAGFSTGMPWLPVPADHRARAVARQEADPASVLHGFRRILRWRRDQPALRWGDIRFIDTPEPVLAFFRCHAGETLLVAINLDGSALQVPLQLDGHWQPVEGHGLAQGSLDGGRLCLPGHGVLFARQA
jgi:alpha-glucosidase